MNSKYEAVIGLEVHVQLRTETKLFCSCPASYSTLPNSQVCNVCLGHPGVLPKFNEKVLEYAIKAGLALKCNINNFSMFDRKNYNYPDLPKGYQISQFYYPYAQNGSIDIELEDDKTKKIRIERIHIEEDAGKLVHNEFTGESYVDLNRASVPLIEIVTKPDLSNSMEAHLYLSKLKSLIKYTGVSDVSMELGSLRCDANVSIMPAGSFVLGTRCEIKNLNSFKAVMKAIDYEISRQESILESGFAVTQETRLWDEARQVTRTMRSKEEAQDYRYFPDPDLVPVIITKEEVDRIREQLPELPEAKFDRFIKSYDVTEYDANILVSEMELADYFEIVAKKSENDKAASNWIITEVLRILKDKNIEISQFNIEPSRLGSLITLIDSGAISGKIAKELFEIMLEDAREPEEIVIEKGMQQITDESVIQQAIQKVFDANPKIIENYKNGKTSVIGFLVGQTIKETGGRANPEMVNKLILEKLNTN